MDVLQKLTQKKKKTYMGSRPGAVVAPSIISSENSDELNGDGNCRLKEEAIVKNHKNNKNNKNTYRPQKSTI